MPCISRLPDYFNSQPHEEADVDYEITCDSAEPISTHSLTKRLTYGLEYVGYEINISTHSLTKRLTLIRSEHRTHIKISTHSLTKRLTA